MFSGVSKKKSILQSQLSFNLTKFEERLLLQADLQTKNLSSSNQTANPPLSHTFTVALYHGICLYIITLIQQKLVFVLFLYFESARITFDARIVCSLDRLRSMYLLMRNIDDIKA